MLRRNTGSKDPEIDCWVKAQVTIATQMLSLIKLGEDIDANNVSLKLAFEGRGQKKYFRHAFLHAVVFCDENHCIDSIVWWCRPSEGSFSRRHQYRIAVDPKEYYLGFNGSYYC
jgi:hypothetical protein